MRCDICKCQEATRDSKTIYGCFAYVCEDCFEKVGIDVFGLYTMLSSDAGTDELYESVFKDLFKMGV